MLAQSGYRAEFLPALHAVLQPRAPSAGQPSKLEDRLSTEAFYISHTPFFHRQQRSSDPPSSSGGEYIVFWFLCQIPADALLEQGTRMPDEQGFVTHLLPFEEAVERMSHHGDSFESAVLTRAIQIWQQTKAVLDDAANPPIGRT